MLAQEEQLFLTSLILKIKKINGPNHNKLDSSSIESGRGEKMLAYGPVPSRRLGKSLGINNIPPKICTYSCVYCQLGRTNNLQLERKEFYKPQEIFKSVKNKIKSLNNDSIDYLAYVPDGEPTLDIHLGKEIDLLKKLGFKIAVITNSSLIWDDAVKEDLYKADWVSVKVDAISSDIWRKINRPHGYLNKDKILEGLSEFSQFFKGHLVTETMIVKDINDGSKELEKISDFINAIKPKKAYISVPIRPPAENWVKKPGEEHLNAAYQIFSKNNVPVEYLIGYEGNAFSSTGDFVEDILSITSVHPIREEGIHELLKKTNESWDLVKNLLKEEKIIETKYNNKKFYLRNFKKTKK